MKKDTTHPQQAGAKAGFTLIELSIVLVIIGLIVGGVLVGQDLIKAAELRAGVSQIEKYDSATNTFRSKYNALPGDIVNPGNFGFSTTGVSATDTGDGDGVLDRAADDANDINRESVAFFRHLFQANLIPESITAADFTPANLDEESQAFPPSKMARGLRVAAYGASGLNYYALTQIALENGEATITNGTEMENIAAFGFDSKLDDGNPTTGKVVAITDLTTVDAGNAGASATHCVDTTGNDLYQTSSAAIAGVTYCSLRIRASF